MADGWRPPTLHTPRLLLRPLTDADLEGIFAYASNPAVTRYTLFETHESREDSRTFLEGFVAEHYAQQEPCPLGICLREEPARVIGTLGCHWASRTFKTMDLGYAVGEEHWGRGYVVEASRALLDHVFAAYDVLRVQAHCVVENTASERVMQKLGMTREGCLRSAGFRRGRSWDLVLYSVLRREWPFDAGKSAAAVCDDGGHSS